MVFFRLLEVKGFPLFFTCSCQQVVKHMVVSKKQRNKKLLHCNSISSNFTVFFFNYKNICFWKWLRSLSPSTTFLILCSFHWDGYYPPMYQNSLIIYAPPKKPYAFSSRSVTVLIITMNMLILANWLSGMQDFILSAVSTANSWHPAIQYTVLSMLFWKQACYVQQARMSAW